MGAARAGIAPPIRASKKIRQLLASGLGSISSFLDFGIVGSDGLFGMVDLLPNLQGSVQNTRLGVSGCLQLDTPCPPLNKIGPS